MIAFSFSTVKDSCCGFPCQTCLGALSTTPGLCEKNSEVDPLYGNRCMFSTSVYEDDVWSKLHKKLIVSILACKNKNEQRMYFE